MRPNRLYGSPRMFRTKYPNVSTTFLVLRSGIAGVDDRSRVRRMYRTMRDHGFGPCEARDIVLDMLWIGHFAKSGMLNQVTP